MRSDMFEVIIERPRAGGRGRRGDGRRTEPRRQQEAPAWEPVSRGRGTKHLNENLAPLRRFLGSRVGRPWDAVRSEICALLNVRSAVQKHVLDHVKDMVEENTVLVAGQPHHAPHHGRSTLITGGRWDGFYVCPLTGALRRSTIRRRRRAVREQSPDVRRLDEAHEVRRLDSVWYLITFAPVPPPGPERARCRDRILGDRLDRIDAQRLQVTYGRYDRYAAVKKQLSTREVRAFVG